MRWRRAPAELARRLFGDGRSSLMGDGAVGRRLEPKSRAAAGVAQREREIVRRSEVCIRCEFRVTDARDGAAGRRAEKNSRAAPGVNINEDHVRPLLCLGEILGRGGLAVERRVSWPEGQDYEQSPKRWRKDKKDCAGIAFAALSMSFLGDGCSLCFRDGLLLCHGALRRRLENSSRAREGAKKLSGDGRSLCCSGDGRCVVAVLPWRSLSGGRSRLSGGAPGGKLKEKQQDHCGQVPAALGPHTPFGRGCGHELAGAGGAVTVKLTLSDELLAQA